MLMVCKDNLPNRHNGVTVIIYMQISIQLLIQILFDSYASYCQKGFNFFLQSICGLTIDKVSSGSLFRKCITESPSSKILDP